MAISSHDRRTLKCILLGDSSTGKTTFCQAVQSPKRFATAVTLGASEVSFKCDIMLNGRHTTDCILLDTCGQERFASLTSTYLRLPDVIFLMCSLVDCNSIHNLKKWLTLALRTDEPTLALSASGSGSGSGSDSDISAASPPSSNDTVPYVHVLANKLDQVDTVKSTVEEAQAVVEVACKELTKKLGRTVTFTAMTALNMSMQLAQQIRDGAIQAYVNANRESITRRLYPCSSSQLQHEFIDIDSLTNIKIEGNTDTKQTPSTSCCKKK
jgi:GTPase SAR1 family protein